MTIAFKKEQLIFEMTFRTESSSGYEEKAKLFRKYGLNLPDAKGALVHSGDDHDTYRIQTQGASNCFIACVVTASSSYNNDDEFCTWSEHALYTLSQIPSNERKVIATAEEDFKKVQFRKNQELLDIQNQLKELAKIFSLDYTEFHTLTEANTLKQIFAQNQSLIEENNKLYRQIVEAARKESALYNESALKAIILSLSMGYVSKHSPALLGEAKTAYEEHLNPPGEVKAKSEPVIARVQLPEPGKIHPFLEPKKEFPHLNEQDSYDLYRHNSYDRNRVTITKSDVNILNEKINRLFDNHQKSQKDQKGWLALLITLKNAFGYIYDKIISALKTANQSSNPVEKHSDLAQNIVNITNGKDISRTAQLIHRFNSRPSPLVHVIHDDTLNNEEKEDLLAKLVHAKPYRFRHEESEERSNVNIPAKRISSSSLEQSDPKGSPLHHAVKVGTASMVRILLESGAEINAKGECIGIRSIDYHDVTALHMAVAQGDIEKVTLLLQSGADANATNASGQTALHTVSNGEILKLLIQHGANINSRDKNGQTPLHFAVKQGKQEIVKALVAETNLQVDLQDNLGNSALHLAAATSFEMSGSRHYSFSDVVGKGTRAENLETIAMLIGKGASVNQTNSRGYTPLHLAVLDGRGTIGYDSVRHRKELLDYQHIQNQVQLLCDNGANVDMVAGKYEKNKDDYSSNEGTYHPAPASTPLLALYTLESSEAARNKKLAQARLNLAKYLIERGANYKSSYQQRNSSFGSYQEEGNTLLHQCAKLADTQGFAHFTQLGLDPNYQDSSVHKTPFHIYMNSHANHYDWQRCGATDLQAFFDCGVDVNKTCGVKVEISWDTLDERSGLSLHATTLEAIFRDDNIISQKAKTMGLVVDGKNNREVLKKVYQQILNEQYKGEYERLEIIVPLTALEYGNTGHYLTPSQEAAQMIKKQGDQPSVRPFTA